MDIQDQQEGNFAVLMKLLCQFPGVIKIEPVKDFANSIVCRIIIDPQNTLAMDPIYLNLHR